MSRLDEAQTQPICPNGTGVGTQQQIWLRLSTKEGDYHSDFTRKVVPTFLRKNVYFYYPLLLGSSRKRVNKYSVTEFLV